MATEAETLARRIATLEPAERLRLAASLLERKRPDLAHKIAHAVVIELGAAMALQMKETK